MRRSVVFFSLGCILSITASLCPAQTASINGTVSDSSGAVVDHARITVRNMATNAIRNVETSSAGVYNIAELPAGPYEMTVEKAGFKSVKYQSLTLTVDQALTLNAKLEVGSNTEQVTVEGGTVAPINTTDAQVSNVIDEKQIGFVYGSNFSILSVLGSCF